MVPPAHGWHMGSGFAVSARTVARRSRRGMTLVEVIMSLTILGGVMLSLGAYTARLSRTASVSNIRK